MQRVQAKMKAVVSGCRETTRERLSGEDRWASNWETLLAQMDV